VSAVFKEGVAENAEAIGAAGTGAVEICILGFEEETDTEGAGTSSKEMFIWINPMKK
jgi:hypothetical protein